MKDIVQYLLGLQKGQKYSESVRTFALTLRYYSPRAYEYVRAKFNKNLPHTTTINRWYQQSSVQCESGICKRSIELIKAKVIELRNEGKDLYCGIVHDEMSIRDHVQWLDDKKEFSGFITFGKILEDADHLPVASNVLAFLLSGINTKFHLPIGIYFVDALEGIDKAILLQNIIKVLTEIGVKVLTLTSDGASTNITATEILGCSFDFNNFKPYFANPYDGSIIHVYLDPPHMLKLVRGTLGSFKHFFDRNGRVIEWSHFEKLVELLEREDYATHKMTRKHIDYHRSSMKVLLAVQTLSNSTGLAMQSAQQRRCPGFENASGTIEFCIRMDKLFDILNSDEQRPDNIYKSPITPETNASLISFIDDTIDYIKGLKIEPNALPIIESERKVGFKGLIINAENSKTIYKNYVETNQLLEFPVRTICQCPLESLFSRCRSYSLLGYNTNPTVLQFKSAMRKILVNNEITSSVFANCEDRLDLLNVSSRVKSKPSNASPVQPQNQTSQTPHPPQRQQTSQALSINAAIDPYEFSNTHNQQYNIDDPDQMLWRIASNKDIAIAFRAGQIDKKILESSINCPACAEIIPENEKLIIEGFPLCRDTRVPCKDTYIICKTAQNVLDTYKLKIGFNYFEIRNNILSAVSENSLFTGTDFSDHPTHETSFIEFIVETYINIWAIYIARKASIECQKKKNETKEKKQPSNRQKKVKHFKGC